MTTHSLPGGPPNRSQSSRRVSLQFPALWKVLPTLCEGLPTTPGTLGGLPDHSRPSVRPPDHSRAPEGLADQSMPSGRAFRPIPILWEGLPTLRDGLLTTPDPKGGPPYQFQPLLWPTDHSQLSVRPPDHSRPPGGPSDQSMPSVMASQPLPALRDCLPTTPDPHRGPLDHS